MYDLPELHRQMLDVLGIQDADKIIPLSEEMKPRDPVSENMDVLNSKPLKAFMYQDHEAHIQTHMLAIQDPKIQQLVGQSPMAQMIAAAMAAHVQEHLGFQYRKEMEKQLGIELPPPGQQMPEDLEIRLSSLVSQAAQKLYNKDIAEEQQKKMQEQMEDPNLQLQKAELELRAQDLQRKAQADKARVVSDIAKAEMQQETESKRIETQANLEGARLGVEIAKGKEALAAKQNEAGQKNVLAKAKLAAEAAKVLVDDDRKARGQ